MPKILVTLGKKLTKELDDLAEEGEVSRSETIRGLLRTALDALESDDDETDEEDSEDDDDEKDEEEETCAECKETIPADSVFCPYCGVQFAEEEEDDEEEETEKSKED